MTRCGVDAVSPSAPFAVIDAPQIVLSPPRAVAVVPLRLVPEAVPDALPAALDELYAALAAQGVAPAGPPFTYHRPATDGVADFELGVPVPTPVTARGRVVPTTLPGARVAVATWRGPYDRLGDAWASLAAWLALRGHVPADECWECYLGPADAPVTELHRPLAD